MKFKRIGQIIVVAIIIQYILLFTEYSFDYILPYVQMGTRLWPLYFFILDFVTIILIVISLIYAFYDKTKLKWLIIVLLFFPILMVIATYSDLSVRYCTTPACVDYQEPLDLSNIKLINNVK
ncbi:hypothetical protein KBD45_08480 [Candidatus Dojkabacteria bacterium]|nr:hypothetical protein [Candidatus Dojkabacteria bacterium]